MSVKVVTNTAEDTAGSMPNRRRSNGTPAPARAETSRFPTMAMTMARPRPMLPFQTHPSRPATNVRAKPWNKPSSSSRPSRRIPLWWGTSQRARPRTTNVTICVPAIPPCPATTGKKTASMATAAIVDSNRLTTAAAARTVPRLTSNHGRRCWTDKPQRTEYPLTRGPTRCAAYAPWPLLPRSASPPRPESRPAPGGFHRRGE